MNVFKSCRDGMYFRSYDTNLDIKNKSTYFASNEAYVNDYGDNTDHRQNRLYYPFVTHPTAGKWDFVDKYWDYVHSSAYYYVTGQHRGYEVFDYASLQDKVLKS